MASVLHLSRKLEVRPEVHPTPGVHVRHYQGEVDIEPWLELRNRTFARQRIGVRQWARTDFLAEFIERWWWQPQQMWLAENRAPHAIEASQPQLIGAVILAMRGEPQQARPVVHWLMVHPAWRRRGIGRLLIANLEAAAWDAGHRQIWLETHAAWEAGVNFYQSLGYQPE